MSSAKAEDDGACTSKRDMRRIDRDIEFGELVYLAESVKMGVAGRRSGLCSSSVNRGTAIEGADSHM